MKHRHRARRLALQGLCCLDAQGPKAVDTVDMFLQDSNESPETIDAARRFIREGFRTRDDLDKLLVRHARHWDLDRLALVDRNILRLAICELRSEQTPFKVVIDEALRLAREFSTAESPRFVNGVLDAIVKELQGDDAVEEKE